MEDLVLQLSERESLYQLYLYAFNRQDSPARKALFMDRVEHGKQRWQPGCQWFVSAAV